jgi:ribose/xylose/arabinose/galactoside ABC-type transport system permease subunit
MTSTREDGAEQAAAVAVDPAPPPESGARRKRPRGDLSLLRAVGAERWLTFLVFILIFLGYGAWLGSKFLSSNNRLLDVHQNVPLLLVSLALAVCLASGQFDLSVGGMATLTTYLTVGLVVNQHWPFAEVLVVCVAIGLVGGIINAYLVIGLRVNAFIATLGTGGAFAGISTVYSGGTQLSPVPNSPQLPHWFSGIGSFGSYQTKAPVALTWAVLLLLLVVAALATSERFTAQHRQQALIGMGVAIVVAIVIFATVLKSLIDDMPYTALFVLAVAFVLWVACRYTSFGRGLYATGGNAQAARLAGVRVQRIKASAFIISGLLSSVAGIVLASIQGSASPNIAQGFLLPAFAAAFLSTVLLSNGRFHIWGTLLGGIFLIWVSQGLIVGGVNFTWTDVVNGIVLIAAVSLSTVLRRSEGK